MVVGWVIDVLVGWLVGSIVLGIVFEIAAALVGAGQDAQNGMRLTGVVVGTIVGIWWMRRRRSTAEV